MGGEKVFCVRVMTAIPLAVCPPIASCAAAITEIASHVIVNLFQIVGGALDMRNEIASCSLAPSVFFGATKRGGMAECAKGTMGGTATPTTAIQTVISGVLGVYRKPVISVPLEPG